MTRSHVTKVFVLSILAAVAWAYPVGGWGGFGVTGMMVETRGLNDSLTTINREILGGSQTVEFTSPFLLLGGQGGGEIGIFSIGAWGGGLFAREEADVLSASLGYFAGALEPGISWKPVEFIWLRPSIDLGGSIFNLELREKGIPQDTTIYQSSITGWQINVGAALALHLNVPVGKRTMLGLMAKVGYLYPGYKVWTVPNDEEPAAGEKEKKRKKIDPVEDFGLDGPCLSIGVNFASRKAMPKPE